MYEYQVHPLKISKTGKYVDSHKTKRFQDGLRKNVFTNDYKPRAYIRDLTVCLTYSAHQKEKFTSKISFTFCGYQKMK